VSTEYGSYVTRHFLTILRRGNRGGLTYHQLVHYLLESCALLAGCQQTPVLLTSQLEFPHLWPWMYSTYDVDIDHLFSSAVVRDFALLGC
jgi:hypothetical protein